MSVPFPGNILPPSEILNNLSSILNSSDPVAPHPIGVLTTEHREVWAAARSHLESLGNSQMLDKIDTSIMSLVLDDDSPRTDTVQLLQEYLHGDGTNRFVFIVTSQKKMS